MVNLIVDIGNSRIKVAAVEGLDVASLEVGALYDESMAQRVEQMVSRYSIREAIVSSTRGDQPEIVEALGRIVDRVVLFDSSTPLPIEVSYSTPQTLGRDRVAAAVGAKEVYGQGDKLIIDLGTAITIDRYTEVGGFEGGAISPGVIMRFKALNSQTASLPLCTPCDVMTLPEVGGSTLDSIVGGVMRGVAYELEGYIARFREKNSKNLVIFTGGDAKYFDKRIKNAIFADVDLVVIGLNRILIG